MERHPTAIITGASTGLGLELALQLADEGRLVLGVARHRPEDGRWRILEEERKALFLEADVSDPNTATEAVAQMTSLGNYNLLVNCAGDGVFGAADSYTSEDIAAVLSANLIGLIKFSVASIPVFASTGGAIVNIMSTAAQVGRANETIYCASKWGARGYTEAIRAELKGKPIRVLAVYPGGMKTPFWAKAKGHSVNPDKFMDPKEVANEIILSIQQKRTLQVTDVILNRA